MASSSSRTHHPKNPPFKASFSTALRVLFLWPASSPRSSSPELRSTPFASAFPCGTECVVLLESCGDGSVEYAIITELLLLPPFPTIPL